MKILLLLAVTVSLTACGQQQQNPQTKNHTTDNNMNLARIANPTVVKAIEALQAHDTAAWYACFTDDVVFTDDGRTLNFQSFFDNAFVKKEKFLDIDTVEKDGTVLYGNFFAGQWGTFRVYFKFEQEAHGKFGRLDIGQAPKK